MFETLMSGISQLMGYKVLSVAEIFPRTKLKPDAAIHRSFVRPWAQTD